jgi:uncharacterized protein YndB with AHSA1/START domain
MYRLYGDCSTDQVSSVAEWAPTEGKAMNLAHALEMNPYNSPQAPLQIEFRVRLNLPPAEVFELVTTGLAEWFGAIHSVNWNHKRSDRGSGTLGVRSERVCNFGGKTLIENILEFEPGRRYAYSADMTRSQMKMPLRNHLGTFEVVPAEGGSVVIWRQYFVPQWFVPGAVLRWQMRDKMMRPALEVLIKKYGGELLSVK